MDVEARDNHDMTPLHIAAESAALDSLRLLIEEFDTNINAKNYLGETPLILAAKYGHIDII